MAYDSFEGFAEFRQQSFVGSFENQRWLSRSARTRKPLGAPRLLAEYLGCATPPLNDHSKPVLYPRHTTRAFRTIQCLVSVRTTSAFQTSVNPFSKPHDKVTKSQVENQYRRMSKNSPKKSAGNLPGFGNKWVVGRYLIDCREHGETDRSISHVRESGHDYDYESEIADHGTVNGRSTQYVLEGLKTLEAKATGHG